MRRVIPPSMKSSPPGLALRSLPALEVIGSDSDLVARSDLGCEFGFTAERSWCRRPQGPAVPCDSPTAVPRAWARRCVTQQGPQFARTEGLFLSERLACIEILSHVPVG